MPKVCLIVMNIPTELWGRFPLHAIIRNWDIYIIIICARERHTILIIAAAVYAQLYITHEKLL